MVDAKKYAISKSEILFKSNLIKRYFKTSNLKKSIWKVLFQTYKKFEYKNKHQT
jgi:hypothetical protein